MNRITSTLPVFLLGIAACSHQATTAETPRAAKRGSETSPAVPATGPARFAVRHYTGAEDKPTEDVGVVSIDAKGLLKVERADNDVMGTKLREAVARLNGSDTIVSEDTRIGDSSQIPRGDPRFVDAERAQLRRLYGFELVR